jgi:hypothetical protein
LQKDVARENGKKYGGNGFKDLTGMRFGRLLVVDLNHKNRAAYWNCLCDCGNMIVEKTKDLNYGSVKSCGCLQSDSVLTGEDHWNWKGGITPENMKIRGSLEYRTWRINVFKRDNFICQNCGKTGDLNAHHIKSFSEFPEERFNVANGITLCIECHKETDNYGGKAIKKY